jgi:hypothetical protein
LQPIRLEQTRLYSIGFFPVQVDAGATAEILAVSRRLYLQDTVDHPHELDQVRDCCVDRRGAHIVVHALPL